MSAEDARAVVLAPARRGGRRHLTFDNGRSEDYDSVFVQHESGEWDRVLVARDDGTIATLIADLINAAARRDAPDEGLREWVASVRAKFRLPDPSRDEKDYWTGYEAALADVDRFAVRRGSREDRVS